MTAQHLFLISTSGYGCVCVRVSNVALTAAATMCTVCLYMQVLGNGYGRSLVPRPSTPPVFDCLQYARTGGVEGLGMRLVWPTIIYVAPNAVKTSQSKISVIIVTVMSVVLVKPN